MKKHLSLLLIAAMLLSLTACSTETKNPTGSSEAATQESKEVSSESREALQENGEEFGKVTAVDGNTITIETFSQQRMPDGDTQGNGQTPPEMPEGDTQGNGQTPPEMPDGDAQGNGQTPPEMPDGDTQGNGQTPPEMPDGNTQGNGQTPPEMPDGDTQGNGQTPPEMPDGNSNPMETGETKVITITDMSILYRLENNTEVSATLDDITVGVLLKITYGADSSPEKIVIGSESDFGMGGGQSTPGGNNSAVIYGGTTELTAAGTEDGKTYASDTADQSALLISTSEAVIINNPTVTKTGDSDGGDNCNFYGQNAAVLVKDGSETTITGGTVTTDATGANGVFSYGGNGGQNGAAGDGTTVIISDTVITTKGSGSGGIMTTGGGITQATNLTVTTEGQSSAAIRTDRGGGTVTVDGGSYTTNGLGSPAIYSTADITVSNAALISNLSEGVCIEGLNSIELNNCALTAQNTKCNGNATFLDSIMIYQSMSGDAASGTSHFTMNGGVLTSKSGHVFHVTNTSAVITLNEVTIVNEDADNVLLSVCDDGWSGGNNKAVVNAAKQTLNGAILVGSNSELTLSLSEGSSFTGMIGGEIKNAAGDTVSTEAGTVSVTLDDTCTWTLTEDSYVTEFIGDAANIITNGHVLYVNGIALTGTN